MAYNISNLTTEQQMIAETKKFVNSKQRELTQAQYDALSTEEKNNGTIYFITDGESGRTGSGLPPVTSADNGDVLTVVEGAWSKATPENELPSVTSADNGKFLCVVNGSWAADTVPSAESASF